MHVGARHAQRVEAGPDRRQEFGWPAEVELAVQGCPGRDDPRGADVSGLVVVGPGAIVGTRSAVPHAAACGGQCREQRPHLLGEGVLGTVAGCVRATRCPASSWLSCSACRMASTGVTPIPALTNVTGEGPLVEGELSARCCDHDLVADVDRGAKISAGRSVRFDLDADPVVRVGRGSGEGVAAYERRFAVGGLESEGDELARKRARQRCAVLGVELQ